MIRKPALPAIVLALAAATVSAEAKKAAPPPPPGSRVIETTIDAPSLRGNLLGDPDRQGVAVYLPPGYDTSTRRYPVLYLLHGIGDTYTSWTEAWHIREHMDRLIASGRIPEMIVVMPNGRNALLGSFYVDSPVSGNWERFLAEDLVSWVDATYRTIPGAASRAIAGHSMGGFGAIVEGMRHADVFSVVYAASPCCLDMVEDVTDANQAAWRRALHYASFDDVRAALVRGEFYPVAVVALCAALSPDPAKPLHVDFPYRLDAGEIVPAEPAYSRFRHAFPAQQVDEDAPALKTLRGLALDYGVDDQFPHIPVGALAFSARLGEERIPHTLEVYAGDHRKLVEERLESVILPWIGMRLSTAP